MPNHPFRRLFSPSLGAFIRAARRAQDYSLFDFLHGYVYARWPYLYIGIGTGEHRLARIARPIVDLVTRILPPRSEQRERTKTPVTFADTYHGKVVPLEAARQLVSVREPVHIEDLEKVIPYARARAIIMEHPDHVVAIDCPCRAARPNPCLPLDVCLIVGEPFASFTLEHHPDKSRSISPDEAFAILKAEDERGHVHHAFFKDAMLGRFYAICNCCSCCCGAMQAHRRGTPMLASSGYLAEIDTETCIACDACAPYCQFGALSMDDMAMSVDPTACMGCGVCIEKCAQGAITLVRAPEKGDPLEIFQLMETAANSTSR